jgi:hypothetical protein
MKKIVLFVFCALILTSFVYHKSSSTSVHEEKPVYARAIAVKDTLAVGEIYKAKLFLVNGKSLGSKTSLRIYYMSDYGYNIFADDGKQAIVKNDTGYVEFVVQDHKLKKGITICNWGARVTQTVHGKDTTFIMKADYAVRK